MSNKMNMLIAGNNKVYPGMELVIYSTLSHNKGINWYVFTMDIVLDDDGNNRPMEQRYFEGLGEWHKNKLRKIVNHLDSSSTITFVDTEEMYKKYFWHNPNEYSWLTPYAPLRTLAEVALPYVPHILYMDCDTAVTGDISTMYWSYLQKGYDYCAYVENNARSGEGEMVSGVMLMNLDKIRQSGFLDRARKNIMETEYEYYDQGAIEDAGKPFPLPDEYSYIHELEVMDHIPTILHFTNQLNPKIYDTSKGREYFFRRYPFLKYVKEGIELLDTINI